MKTTLLLTSALLISALNWAQCTIDASFTWSIVGSDIVFTNTSSSTAESNDYFWEVDAETASTEDATFALSSVDMEGGFMACLTVEGFTLDTVPMIDSLTGDTTGWDVEYWECEDEYCEFIIDSTWSGGGDDSTGGGSDDSTLYITESADLYAIYPNPATENFVIEFSDQSLNYVAIYNMQGVMVRELILDEATEKVSVEIDDLPEGMYAVKMLHNNRSSVSVTNILKR